VAWLMISGADFSTVLKIQQNNDFVKRQVSFPRTSPSRPIRLTRDWRKSLAAGRRAPVANRQSFQPR